MSAMIRESDHLEPLSCTICYESERDLNECERCRQQFCLLCTLYWKLSQDTCPQCRTEPWPIEVPHLVSNHYEGFIQCPNCRRIGCLRCRNSSCREPLQFELLTAAGFQEHIPTEHFCTCRRLLDLYKAIPHCSSNDEIYYWYCSACDLKYCGCS